MTHPPQSAAPPIAGSAVPATPGIPA
ncbi:hypothetical protein GA0115258_110731, partial [Streptomyces sp. LamerLS-31b]